MDKRKRFDSATGVQHVGLKGNGGADIFFDDEDRQHFLHFLARACKKYSVALLGYVLMSNHVHLVFEGEVEKFSKVFQSMGGSFNRWYNTKYEHTGTIYNARYYAKPVNSQQQILNLLVYVFRNPVAAGMVKDARDYEWSSLNATLARNFKADANVSRVDELVSIDYLEATLDAKKDLDDDEVFHLFERYKPNNNSVIAKAKELFKGVVIRNFSKESEEKQRELVVKLLEFGANITQIARISGIKRRRVVNLCA